MKRTLILLAVLLIALNSFGQIQIDRFAKNPTAKISGVCGLMEKEAAHVIAQYPHPKDWRFVVACDEASWRFMATAAGHVIDADDIYGITMPKIKTTFLRGPALKSVAPGQPSATHIIVHELAHIVLHTDDDVTVERTAERWMADHHNYDSLFR